MIAAATAAKNLLADSADLVADFVGECVNPDGGFKGRTGESDLYYTVFGLESLIALDGHFDKNAAGAYLDCFGNGKSLDLTHLACLARCRADIEADTSLNELIANRLEAHRSADGGYSNSRGEKTGSAYGCFLALGAYQDLDIEMPEEDRLADCIESLKNEDGSYSNDTAVKTGSTPATAAAITTLHYLGRTVDLASSRWLLDRSRATGGFTATLAAPIPDMLSTATAVHALAMTETGLERIKQPTIEFVDSLWDTQGAFFGSWLDETLDCEYTFYALLALGHLENV